MNGIISLLRFLMRREKTIYEFQVGREQETKQKMGELLIATLAWDWSHQKSENLNV